MLFAVKSRGTQSHDDALPLSCTVTPIKVQNTAAAVRQIPAPVGKCIREYLKTKTADDYTKSTDFCPQTT